MTEIKIPTTEQARAQVEAKWEAARQEALDYEAKRIVREAENRKRAAEREAERERRHREELARTEKQARKAWRELYTRPIARKLDPWRPYWILELGREGPVFAFTDREALLDARRILATDGTIIGAGGLRVSTVRSGVTGRSPLDADQGIPGGGLRKYVRALADVDPSPEKLAKLAAERASEREAEQRTRNERRERDRRRERELATYGVAVSDLPDED